VKFELFMAATMKNAVLWDVTPFGSCKNRRIGGTLRGVFQLLVTDNVVPSWLIISSETSILTRATRHRIPEDGILDVTSSLEVISRDVPPVLPSTPQ
jgi:hypothetical protein